VNDDAPRGSIIRFRFVRERGNLITPSNAHLSPRIEMPDGDSAFPWKRNLHCVVAGLHNRPWTFMDTQGTLDFVGGQEQNRSPPEAYGFAKSHAYARNISMLK